MKRPTALIADDEPLLRRTLARMLGTAWPELEVVAISDLSPERLERSHAAVPEAALFASAEELIATAGIDCLDICTPPSTHAELMRAACEAGVADVLVIF